MKISYDQLIGTNLEPLTFTELITSTSFWRMMSYILIPSLIIILGLIFVIKKLNSKESTYESNTHNCSINND